MPTKGEDKNKELLATRSVTLGFRLPGYEGHVPGQSQAIGASYGAVSANTAETMKPMGVRDGFMAKKQEHVVNPQLQPGVVMEPMRAPSRGYTGHLPGEAHSDNFGKSWSVSASQTTKSGILDAGRPLVADAVRTNTYPTGYMGFRPLTPAMLSS